MTTRAALTLSISALLMGGTMVGCAAHQVGLPHKVSAVDVRAGEFAEASAARAKTALAAHKGASAVPAAEEAVRWVPENVAYRVLLGESYLTAGRFMSARDAFTDALALSPNDGRVALKLALSQTASGDWASARKTLDAHADEIPAADRGLAIALAGDPATAVNILTEAARAPGADAKVRQNLALSLALAGRWAEAKTVASVDLGADQLDRRMREWAAFASPKSASQQVASLLGVTPAADRGQPVSLALSASVPNRAVADETPTTAPAMAAAEKAEPVVEVASASTPASSAWKPDSGPTEFSVTATAPATVRPPVAYDEGSQIMPVKASVKTTPKPVAKPRMLAAATPMAVRKGNFFVQLGAYKNIGSARDGWVRATRRYADFAGQTPHGMPVKTNGVRYYRLSLGGFDRAAAETMCQSYRTAGGVCFVRTGKGDQVARWVSKTRQVAANTRQPTVKQLAMR